MGIHCILAFALVKVYKQYNAKHDKYDKRYLYAWETRTKNYDNKSAEYWNSKLTYANRKHDDKHCDKKGHRGVKIGKIGYMKKCW